MTQSIEIKDGKFPAILIPHFVSQELQDCCTICGDPATHRIKEAIPADEPCYFRHNYEAVVCCDCFRMIFGAEVTCPVKK